MLQPDKASAQLFDKPCSYGIIKNICDDGKLKAVKEAILKQPFYHKSNDLYEFYQTEDLKTTQDAVLQEFMKELYSPEWMQFMSDLTGLELSPHRLDISAHRYPQGGYLLCHDDDIADYLDQGPESTPVKKVKTAENASSSLISYSRRIAFIIYLVEQDWKKEDGGMLQFYNVVSTPQATYQPGSIAKSIVPQWNTMAFFQVTPTSYHQVQEVLRKQDRVSISGWFHGPTPLDRPVPHLVTAQEHVKESILSMISIEGLELKDFIHPAYLESSAMDSIVEQFANEGCINLTEFVCPLVYQEVINELQGLSKEHWTLLGPPTLQSIEQLADASSCPSTRKLVSFLSSPIFKSYLNTLTQLQLESKPSVTLCHQLQPSSYTLLHDEATEPVGLDVILHLLPPTLPPSSLPSHGQRVYVCQKETLATLTPKQNTLSLVLRDEKDVLRFIKYVSHGWESNPHPRWWNISYIWQECDQQDVEK